LTINNTTTERIDVAGLHGENDASFVMACLKDAIKAAVAKGATAPKLSFDCEDDVCIVSVKWVRPATEREMRLRREMASAEEMRERAEYERLKKKFG